MSDVVKQEAQAVPQNAVHHLTTQTTNARVLLANMADILGDDDNLIASTIEGETNLREALGTALKRHAELEVLIAGLKTMMGHLATRGERFEAQAGHLKTAICAAMEAGQIKKFEHPLGTMSLRNVPPKAVITSEAEIPASFWKPSDPKLDRKAVLDALKDKQDVPGAMLSNGSVTVAIKLS